MVWTSSAEQETAEAALWYENHQPGLGEQFLTATEYAASAAATSPEMYARVQGELRRVLVRRFPYALIVREAVDELLDDARSLSFANASGEHDPVFVVLLISILSLNSFI